MANVFDVLDLQVIVVSNSFHLNSTVFTNPFALGCIVFPQLVQLLDLVGLDRVQGLLDLLGPGWQLVFATTATQATPIAKKEEKLNATVPKSTKMSSYVSNRK